MRGFAGLVAEIMFGFRPRMLKESLNLQFEEAEEQILRPIRINYVGWDRKNVVASKVAKFSVRFWNMVATFDGPGTTG